MHQGNRRNALSGLRIRGDAVRNGCSVLRQDLHISLRRVDRVRRQRIRAENPDVLQELDRRHAVLFPDLRHLVIHLRRVECEHASRFDILLIDPL